MPELYDTSRRRFLNCMACIPIIGILGKHQSTKDLVSIINRHKVPPKISIIYHDYKIIPALMTHFRSNVFLSMNSTSMNYMRLAHDCIVINQVQANSLSNNAIDHLHASEHAKSDMILIQHPIWTSRLTLVKSRYTKTGVSYYVTT